MKVVDSFLIRNSANILTANTDVNWELFRTFTYATSAGSSTSTVTVKNTSGFSNGDTVYIGTAVNASTGTNVFSISNVASATSLTISANASWSDNACVAVKRKTGAGTDAYVDAYEDPEFATAITMPFPADDDNEFHVFVLPGRYAVRYSDAAALTLQLDHEITFGATENVVQVVPTHDSATKGILEAAKKLPSVGGVVYCPAGTYAMTGGLTLNSTVAPRITIRGDGPDVTILRIDTDARLISVLDIPFQLENLTVRAGVNMTVPIVQIDHSTIATNLGSWAVRNVRFDPNDKNCVSALYLLECRGGSMGALDIGDASTAAAGNGFTRAITLDACKGVLVTGVKANRRTSTAGDIAFSVSGCDSITVAGNNVSRYETMVSLSGSTDNCYVSGNHPTTVTTEISDTSSGANNWKAPSGATDITYTGDVVFNGGFRQQVDGWRITNVAQNQTDVEMVRQAASPTEIGRWRAPRSGSVTGVFVAMNAPVTSAGQNLTITVYKNTGDPAAAGSSIGLSVALDSVTNPRKNQTTQAKNTDTFAAGDELYLLYTTGATFLPTGSGDVTAGIEVET
jgi:hypothetical protein